MDEKDKKKLIIELFEKRGIEVDEPDDTDFEVYEEYASIAANTPNWFEKEIITTIYFQMTSDSEVERARFSGKNPTDKEVDLYFEEKCGGVYKWFR